jgi:uncharacterized repeat protein (TIGR03803 family)
MRQEPLKSAVNHESQRYRNRRPPAGNPTLTLSDAADCFYLMFPNKRAYLEMRRSAGRLLDAYWSARLTARSGVTLFTTLALFLASRVPGQVIYQQIHSFGPSNAVGLFPGNLVKTSDGTLYGATATGASGGGGSIFRMDSAGTNPVSIFSLDTFLQDAGTQVRIVAGSDGFIYCWYHQEGSSSGGGLVKVATNGGAATKLLDATNATGRVWSQMLQGADGKLYAISAGDLQTIQPDGNGYQKLSVPNVLDDSLLLQATNGRLYATESNLRLVSFDTSGGTRAVVRDFSAFPAFEGLFLSALTQASDGLLYGVVTTSGQSMIFRMGLDGSGFTNFFSLPSAPDGSTYGKLVESLVEGPDGRLYGSLSTSAKLGAGYLFAISREGTGFTNLLNFPIQYLGYDAGADVNRTGSKPLLFANDGRLFGSSRSLATGNGAVFEIGMDGAGFATTYTFPKALDEGNDVAAGLIQGTNGFLYGTARSGGAGGGVLFRLHPNGTGFEALKFFESTDLSEGGDPAGGVTQGGDGRLYGALAVGGSQPGGGTAFGTVYRINPDGSGFQLLHTFSATGADGRQSVAAPIQASDGALYGTTYAGGGAAAGTIYQLASDGGSYSIILRFTNSVSGQNPSSQLLEGRDGLLYGVTESGGPLAGGAVFSVSKQGTGFRVLKGFSTSGSSLRTPKGALIQGPSGVLYGTASLGGSSGFGGLFSILPEGTNYTVLYEFAATGGDGREPEAGLAFGNDGFLYGTTAFGGGAINGSIFRIHPDGSGYEKLRAFTGLAGDGGNPTAWLARGQDGSLYSTTSLGGAANLGTVFRLNFSSAQRPALRLSVGVNVELTVLASVGAHIQVDSSPSLATPIAWQNLTNFFMAGTNLDLNLGLPSIVPQFFRAYTLP